MIIRLLVSLSGPDGAFGPDVNDGEYECSSEEAQRHVAAFNAEFIREEKTEKAVKHSKTEKAKK